MVVRPTVAVSGSGPAARTLRVTELFAVAVLRVSGIQFLGTEPAANGRIGFLFDDGEGQARALLEAHQRDGIRVNSLEYVSALTWARDIVFAAKA